MNLVTVKVITQENTETLVEHLQIELDGISSSDPFVEVFHHISKEFSSKKILGFEIIEREFDSVIGDTDENVKTLIDSVNNLTKDSIVLGGGFLKIVTDKTFEKVEIVPGFFDSAHYPVDAAMTSAAFCSTAAIILQNKHKVARERGLPIDNDEINLIQDMAKIGSFLSRKGTLEDESIITSTGKVFTPDNSEDLDTPETSVLQ